MKRNKGFTLIELLAVIVILGVIMLIAVPSVMNYIERSKRRTSELSVEGYVDAIKKSILNNQIKGTDLQPGTYKVSNLNSTVDINGSVPSKGLIIIDTEGNISSGVLCINNYEVTYENNIAKITNENCNNVTEELPVYKETVLNGTDPVVSNELIPVTIAPNGTVTYADISTKWYDYENKIWANAVKLISGTFKVGDVIPESSIGAYFVWIPRYKYKLFNTGSYTSSISSTPPTSLKTTIEIAFESKDDPISTGNTVNSWLTHPAFISFDVNGIWVGKYETGYLGATSAVEAQVVTNDPTKLISKPNSYSWTNNNIYNFFVASYNYDTLKNSHMMKNTEWGAVAYLSHSIYGINTEVNTNNSPTFKTGSSALTTIPVGTTGDGPTFNEPYNTTTGYLASTTGNITGVYDMSGGVWEYMASHMSSYLGSSGFDTTNIAPYPSKFFDIYSNSSYMTNYSYRILGDATAELGPFYYFNSNYHNSWYDDYAYFLETTYPWFGRGGYYFNGSMTGQFAFDRSGGPQATSRGTRLVLAF